MVTCDRPAGGLKFMNDILNSEGSSLQEDFGTELGSRCDSMERTASEYMSKHVGIYGNTYGNKNMSELSEGGNHSNWACSNMCF